MTQTESTTKPRGLMARLFGDKKTPPTVADVRQQITRFAQERDDLLFQLTDLESRMGEAWGDPDAQAQLEAEYTTKQLHLKGVESAARRLQTEETAALQREIEAKFERILVDNHVTPRRELFDLESSENLAIVKRGQEINQERRRRRAQIAATSPSRMLLKNDLLKRYPPEVQQGMIARLNAIEAKYADVLTLNVVTLDILESGLFKRENHHER
jgi:hypothetical protein